MGGSLRVFGCRVDLSGFRSCVLLGEVLQQQAVDEDVAATNFAEQDALGGEVENMHIEKGSQSFQSKD